MKVKRPLTEVLPVASGLLEALRPYCERIEFAGSIRRKKEFVGDIEILLQPKLLLMPAKKQLSLFDPLVEKPHPEIMKFISRYHIMRGDLNDGKMLSFVGPGEIQVDVFTANPDNYGYIKILRTGSHEYNTKYFMPKMKKSGYVLDGGYIWNKEKLVPVPEEIDVYRLMGDSEIDPPELRAEIGEKAINNW